MTIARDATATPLPSPSVDGVLLAALASRARALAQRRYDPIGRATALVTITLAGDARVEAAVWLDPVAQPVARVGASARVALARLVCALGDP